MTNTLKFATPLMVALALVGCGKKDKTAEAPVASTPAVTQPAPAANKTTATATPTNNVNPSNSATATATAPASNLSPEEHKKAREKIMKEWKHSNQTIGAMVKDPTKFDAAQVKSETAKLDQDVWVHFADNAKGGDAKDAIWTDKAGFQQEIDKYKKAVTALNTAAATATNVDGIKAQFGDVGASCKSCHEKFKKD